MTTTVMINLKLNETTMKYIVLNDAKINTMKRRSYNSIFQHDHDAHTNKNCGSASIPCWVRTWLTSCRYWFVGQVSQVYLHCKTYYYQSINVAVNDQICVRPGDVIGIHYTEVEDVDGVVPYQQSGRRPTRHNLDLSALVNEPIEDNDLPLQTSMAATTSDFKRVPALQPILTTSKFKRIYIWSFLAISFAILIDVIWWTNDN